METAKSKAEAEKATSPSPRDKEEALDLPENIQRQCYICHYPFRTAKGSWNILCLEHARKWDYFKFIWWPNFYWKWLGLNLIDDLYSYWWLNIAKRKQIWSDASQEGCRNKWCRYCGKGKTPPNL